MAWSTIVGGGKALAAGVLGFLLGMIAWSALSGLLSGVLDQVGVVIPASTWLAAGPIVGGIVAIIAMGTVTEGASS